MGLIERIRKRTERVIQRLSGEYSAGAADIRPDTAAPGTPAAGGDVRVTRARLKRPGAAEDHKDGA